MTLEATNEVPFEYCDHCGRELVDGDHTHCREARTLEPPRYCTACRRRLIVQVVPRGWSARCSRHGYIATPLPPS